MLDLFRITLNIVFFFTVSRRELPWSDLELAQQFNSLDVSNVDHFDLKCNLKSRGYRVIAAPVI